MNKRRIDLVTGPDPDEVVYKNWQLTRLLVVIRRDLLWIIGVGVALIFVLALALSIFAYVTHTHDVDAAREAKAQRARDLARDAQREHDRCEASNASRAEIRDAFEGLYDKFIEASGRSQQALDFKADGMAKLNDGIPSRPC